MANLQVVSRERYAAKRWKRYTSYSFAAKDAVAGLVLQELPKACMSLPVGFIHTEQGYLPVAVQGLKPGQNLFVAPDGRWLAEYTPAAYRGFPFALANTPEGQQVLCFNEDSGLLSEDDGEAFFEGGGEPTQDVKRILDFLGQVSANRQATLQACAALDRCGLIQSWPIQIKGESAEQKVEGLFRIDEAALNALAAEQLAEVRAAGGLPLAYCQLLSMQHLQKLGKLAQAHAQAQAQASLPVTDVGELDLEFLNDGGTIKFS